MGSNSCEDVKISGSNEAKCSEATVEIKIKTLDSETYTMRVDKCVSVPALKEQIATATGILSEEQRLICRGKVLKDDQLLSAYHVEDGHTLHLVVRQPIPPSSESVLDHPATDPMSGTGHGQGGPGVVVGTFSIPEQGDGILPDFSRIISAVLGSFGITNAGSDSETASERLLRPPGRGNSSIFSTDWATSSSQSDRSNGALSPHTAAALESLQPLFIPDSLTTLSQYLSRMRQDFSANVRGQSSNPQTTDPHGSDGQDPDAAASRSTATRGGLPTPGSLAEVMLSTRLILNEQVGECLLQLMRQLEDHANLTDPVARMRTQSNALRSGALLQNLGAFLLELGRTTMTLQMGQTQADAVVNAGPAVFISASGPTPIMVEPNPFQPGTSFGTVPVGTTQLAPGSSNGTVRSGFFPRNIDIRIHTAIVNQREPTGAPPLVQIDPAAAGDTGNSSRGSVGLFYPVLARGQPGNLDSRRGQESDEHRSPGIDAGQQPTLDSAVQQQSLDMPQVEGATHFGSWIQSELSELDQFLRTVPPIEQIDGSDFSTNSATGHMRPTQDDSSSQEAAPIVGDEGTFLSNLLRQIMPVLSENTNGLNNSAAEAQLDRNRGSTSRRRGSPPPPSSSKRQKRE